MSEPLPQMTLMNMITLIKIGMMMLMNMVTLI